MRLIDLTGRTFGELTVIRRGEDRVYRGGRIRHVRWVCRCSCGAEVLVDGDSLKDGRTRSCGHLRAEAVHRRSPLRAYTAERRALRNAVARCTNPNNEHFADYGGRGIRVCAEWCGDGGFERFLADVGPRPKGASLDRVDVNGDYAPGNCRWADRTTQVRNTRRATGNQPLTRSDGTTHTIFEWADLTGLKVGTIRWRLAHGASVDEALRPGDARRSARPLRPHRRVHPDYQIWIKMRSRCTNPDDPKYPDYGGRGIHVCPEWAGSFEAFTADMGPRPRGFTLDRVDVNGDYCPGNCRWASQRVQQNNRRDNVHLTALGVKHTTAEWAAIVGLTGGRIRARLTEWPDAPAPRVLYPADPRRLSPATLAAVDAGEWLRPLLAAAVAAAEDVPVDDESAEEESCSAYVVDVVDEEGHVVYVAHGDDPSFTVYQAMRTNLALEARMNRLSTRIVHTMPWHGRRCADLKALVELRVCMHRAAGQPLANRVRGGGLPVVCVDTGDCWPTLRDAGLASGLSVNGPVRLERLNRTGLRWAPADAAQVNRPRLSPFTIAALADRKPPVDLTELTAEERAFLADERAAVDRTRARFAELLKSLEGSK